MIHRRVGRDINALYQHLTSTENHNNHLAFDEALVVVHVEDENDNSPQFDNGDNPIVAAVPLEASFGFKVVKVNVSIDELNDVFSTKQILYNPGKGC